MIWAWIAMTALVAALLWIHASPPSRGPWEWLAKPAAAMTFVSTAVIAGATRSAFGRVLLAGLVLAALGDVLLIPRAKKAFLAGLTSFLLGHVAYAIACLVRGFDGVVALASAAVLGALAIPILRWLWPHVERPMRGPVLAYVVVITSMVALAAAAAFKGGSWLLLAGALGFYVSDLFVARDRFVQRGFVNRACGLPLYFYSQLLLATISGSP